LAFAQPGWVTLSFALKNTPPTPVIRPAGSAVADSTGPAIMRIARHSIMIARTVIAVLLEA
jgi:hypothetical protein